MTLCPCGSGRALDACCLPYIKGDSVAPTAEALMRSRYTAYTQIAVDYIVSTHDVKNQEDVDREATEKWAREAEWVGLQVVATEKGGADDTTGVVEFIATYKQEGHELKHHERSTFKKHDGRWWYVDGSPVKAKPIRNDVTAGRNDPCPCGSGKKFKRCHG